MVKAIDLKEIFEGGQQENIQAYLNFLDPLEVVDLFYIVENNHYPIIIESLDDEELAGIFPLFEKSLFDDIVEILSREKLLIIFNLLETDDAAYLLKMLPESIMGEVLPELTKKSQIEKIQMSEKGIEF